MSEKRPVIGIRMTNTDWVLEVVALAALLSLVMGVALSYGDLPHTIPTHFSVAGKVDGWGSKGTLFMLPAMGLLFYGMFTGLAKVPHIGNYLVPITEANAERQYSLAVALMRLLKVEILVLFSYISNGIVVAAKSGGNGLSIWFLPFTLGGLWGTVAWYLARSKKAR